tara:strand:- start:24 stop:497 length:474 start_codon:yes stop_codon:yes gene_type:complete
MKHVKQDPREAIRFRALALHEAGWQQKTIAEALGVSPPTVCVWLRRVRELGPEALRAKKPPGRPPRLSEEQCEELRTLLRQGAEAHGFEGDRWTGRRVALVIERNFRTSFSAGHTCKILARIGWSVQKPARRSTRRDDRAVEVWREKTWPELKKRRK